MSQVILLANPHDLKVPGLCVFLFNVKFLEIFLIRNLLSLLFVDLQCMSHPLFVEH